MGESSYRKLNDSTALEITGKIMVSIMIILFFTVLLFLFLRIFFKFGLFYPRYYNRSAAVTSRRHFVTDHSSASHSLDPSVLSSIPVTVFSSKDKEMECAVCLSETLQGEKVRVLPKCNHGFHVNCIDMWFQSNSTCPICRTSVYETKIPAVFPTNVLVWGNQSEVTSLSTNSVEPSNPSSASSSGIRPDEMLVIDIPRQVHDDEELKSPVTKQLKSLRRLLSGEATRVNPSSSSADPGGMGL